MVVFLDCMGPMAFSKLSMLHVPLHCRFDCLQLDGFTRKERKRNREERRESGGQKGERNFEPIYEKALVDSGSLL